MRIINNATADGISLPARMAYPLLRIVAITA